MTGLIRRDEANPGEMLCFSGLNLIRTVSGQLGIYSPDPVSGSGDAGFFPISEETYFTHDRRFEEFRKGCLKRTFAGFLYWHLKYLKKGMGFDNYELESNPESRFHKRLKALKENPEIWTRIAQAGNALRPGVTDKFLSAVTEKRRLIINRNLAILPTFGNLTVEEAFVRSAWEDGVNLLKH